MVRRQIEMDENTDRILTELASEYQGDLGSALADLLQSYESLEGLAEQSENAHEATLRAMRDESQSDFRNGRIVNWDDVKARNGL